MGQEADELLTPFVKQAGFDIGLRRPDCAVHLYAAEVSAFYQHVGGQKLDAGEAFAATEAVLLDCLYESVTDVQLAFKHTAA